jgi:DNA-binding response OmpR family regulator
MADGLQTETVLGEPGPLQKLRILVVDDHPDIARTCAFFLRESGFEVALASTGQDALRLVEEFHPLVVLLDLGLPDLDGFEVARRLRCDLALQTMRIIAITAYGTDECRVQARAVGFDHFLVKPVPFSTLVSVVGSPVPADRTSQFWGRSFSGCVASE